MQIAKIYLYFSRRGRMKGDCPVNPNVVKGGGVLYNLKKIVDLYLNIIKCLFLVPSVFTYLKYLLFS